MNENSTSRVLLPGDLVIEKDEYSTAACTVMREKIFRGEELILSTEVRKWIYPNPLGKSPGFNALELTEEEWPSLADWDGSVVEPDVPEVVDVTLRLYSSIGLDEDNDENEYGLLGHMGEKGRTYVHHTRRYSYGADDHLYPETEWNGAVYYFQYPRSHRHNTKLKNDGAPGFNALVVADDERPSLSSHPPDDLLSERTFHPFSKLPPELQSMVLERSDLVLDTPKHTGIYLRTDSGTGTFNHGVPIMAACSCSPDCWQKWNGICCCSHNRSLFVRNCSSFDPWPCCSGYDVYRNGLMGTSKLIREEALKIFYSQNQFYLDGELRDVIDALKSNHEHWPEQMSLIKHICAKLYLNDWRSCNQAVRDEFFRCIRDLFPNEKLGIRFVVGVSDWEEEQPITPLKDFCQQAMEAELGKVEVFGFGPLSTSCDKSPLFISELSGSFVEVVRRINDANNLLYADGAEDW